MPSKIECSQGPNQETQDCIDLAAKIGDNLGDQEMVKTVLRIQTFTGTKYLVQAAMTTTTLTIMVTRMCILTL